jgi:two-component system response regulator RegA
MAVLVADGDATFRSRIVKLLAKHGYPARSAASCEQARRAIVERAPRFAILDLDLPDRSSLQLLPLLAKRAPQARAIVVSGYATIEAAVEAVRLGACDFLCKPVEASALLGALFLEPPFSQRKSAPPSLAMMEWEYIQRSLSDCGGNKAEAARRLGIHRRSLERRLRRGCPPR